MTTGDELGAIDRARREWEEGSLKKLLDRNGETRPCFSTSSGLVEDRVYTPLDVADLDYLKDLGFPGSFPMTRGIQPNMYRGRLWTMRQYAGYGTAEESNRRYKYLLEQGQTGLSVAFDLPTQIGYDSDDPRAEGEVGKVGVSIDSLKDMELLFEGIALDKVSTSMTINAPAAILLAMYVALAEQKGVPPGALEGTIQNDVLKEYVARGTYIFPPQPSLRLITDTISFCAENVPKWNTMSLSSYHIREAGATAAQEIAFAFANAIAYVQAAIDAGLEVDTFAPRLSWILNTYSHFFEEIAKFRAARRLWAKIMRDRFGAKDPRSWVLRYHTQTGGSTLTAQQPENNVVRATIQGLAAVLGGVQSLAISCRDEALGLPTEESVKLSLRTQQIIAYESGVIDTADPLGGSYYVEWLTNQMEEQVVGYLDEIEAMGGAVAAIENGYMEAAIQRSAYEAQRQVESGDRVVVGVNRFQEDDETPGVLFKMDPGIAELQKARLAELKATRDEEGVVRALSRLRDEAEGTTNLMPSILEAVKAYATLGEMCGVLREVFGEYRSCAQL